MMNSGARFMLMYRYNYDSFQFDLCNYLQVTDALASDPSRTDRHGAELEALPIGEAAVDARCANHLHRL